MSTGSPARAEAAAAMARQLGTVQEKLDVSPGAWRCRPACRPAFLWGSWEAMARKAPGGGFAWKRNGKEEFPPPPSPQKQQKELGGDGFSG